MQYILPFGQAHGSQAWRTGPKAARLSQLSVEDFWNTKVKYHVGKVNDTVEHSSLVSHAFVPFANFSHH